MAQRISMGQVGAGKPAPGSAESMQLYRVEAVCIPFPVQAIYRSLGNQPAYAMGKQGDRPYPLLAQAHQFLDKHAIGVVQPLDMMRGLPAQQKHFVAGKTSLPGKEVIMIVINASQQD